MDFAEREYHCPKENQIYPSIPVSGAGSCLFQSFTYFLFNKDISYDLAQNLRMECCYYIINNSQIFLSFIDSLSVEDYVNNLRNPRTSGDHIEIFCISNLYRINVWIYERNVNNRSLIKIRSKITSPLARNCDVPVKLLFFEDALHYEPLIPREYYRRIFGSCKSR